MYKKSKNLKIYFDNAASTPIDSQVLKAMFPYMNEKFGNASSTHSFGQETMAAINKARKQIADFLNCSQEEVIFTSGATESNNLAIQGLIREFLLNEKSKNDFIPHIITSQIEHPSVLEVCKNLEKEGVEVTYIGVNTEGLIKTEDVQKAIKNNTVFVSIMYVNNEIGTIQSIREMGKMIEKYNKDKQRNSSSPQPLKRLVFHTDATQAVNYCNCDVKHLHVDMLSLSGHKIYGPKGVGALYVSKSAGVYLSSGKRLIFNPLLCPIQYGGHQENGLRSGTYNTTAIVGLGKAVELVHKTKNHKKIIRLRDKIIKGIENRFPEFYINGSMESRIPSNINLSFKNIEGESLMIMLDMEGIAVSTGSACSSGSSKPSYVLTALGLSPRLAEGSIRITLGKYNTAQEVEIFLDKLEKIVKKLQKFSPM